jgi:hypothetical protein
VVLLTEFRSKLARRAGGCLCTVVLRSKMLNVAVEFRQRRLETIPDSTATDGTL